MSAPSLLATGWFDRTATDVASLTTPVDDIGL